LNVISIMPNYNYFKKSLRHLTININKMTRNAMKLG